MIYIIKVKYKDNTVAYKTRDWQIDAPKNIENSRLPTSRI